MAESGGHRPDQQRPAAARRQPGSPEHALRGYENFGYVPGEGSSDADDARHKTAIFRAAIAGAQIAAADPRMTGPPAGWRSNRSRRG
jgi:hypothetical protein